MVINMQPWRLCPVRPFSAAKLLLLFVHPVCDSSLFGLGGFPLTLRMRTVVPKVQPFSQLGAEVLALLWGLCLVLHVHFPVAIVFLANATKPFMLLCFFAPVRYLFPEKVFRWLLYILNKGFRNRIHL